MDLIPIECGSCKAKLKIKANPARMPTEVKCPKCGKPIPVGKGTSPVSTPSAPQPPPPAPAAAQAPETPPPAPVVAPAPVPPPPPASSTAQLTPPPKPAGTPPQAPSPASAPIKKAGAPIVLGQVSDSSSSAMINAKCPACQWSTKVSQSLAGKKIRCKQCSGIILVAQPESAQAPAAPSANETAPTPEPVAVPPPPPPAPVQPPAPEPKPVQPEPPPPPVAEAKPTPSPIAPLPITEVKPVAPPPPPPPAPTSTVAINPLLEKAPALSSGTTVLIAEIATLKSKLEVATRECTTRSQLVAETEKRAKAAESRAQEAEKALHDLAGRNAVENISANRKISDLEAKVADLHRNITTLVAEFKNELEQVEGKVSALKEKVGRYGT